MKLNTVSLHTIFKREIATKDNDNDTIISIALVP